MNCQCGRQSAIINRLDGGVGYSLTCIENPPYDEKYWLGARPSLEVDVLNSKAAAEEGAEDFLSYCNCHRYM